MPDWLIPVAVNVIGGAERDALVKRVRGLIDDGLLSEVRDHPLGAGIEVTAEGRRALAGLPPQVETPDKPEPAPTKSTPPAPPAKPAPTANPDRTAMIAEAAQKVRQRDVVTHDRSPLLYDLLADLGGLVAERLRELRDSGDLDAIGRWRNAGQRIQHHTGGAE